MTLLDRHKVFLSQNYLLYAIAFFIPLIPRLVPVFIVLLGALSIFAIVKKYSRVNLGEVSTLMILLFLLHIIGLTYSENLDRGWFDIEVKLSLMAFPFAFVGFRFVRETNFKRVILMFIYGTSLASLYCLGVSSYKYFILDLPYYHFITTRFSIIVHPSYFALYLIFSILALATLRPSFFVRSKWNSFFNFLFMVFLSIILVLTGSKTGFIMWLIVAISITVSLVKSAKYKLIPILSLIAMLTIIGVIFQSAPLLQSRIVNVLNVAQSDNLKPDAVESTAVRALIYSSALEIISHQDWYGNGTGDFQDVLDAEYNKKNYVQAADKHLNAHNLFLQTWIALGIPGFAMVLGIFILMFINAFRSKEVLFQGFTLFFLIISLTESTFYVQAGVVVFSFFAVLFERKARASG